MELKELMRLDLGALLLRGKMHVVAKEAAPRGRIPFRRSMFALSIVRQLHQLVKCNLPLVTGLQAMSHGAPQRHWRVFILMANRLEQGCSLAEAMEETRIFPAYYIDIIRAGEVSGNLESALATLIKHSDNQRKLAKSWMRHLGYVFLLAAIVVSMFAFLCTKVFPIYGQIVLDFGGQPPGPLRALLAFGDFVAGTGMGKLQRAFRIALVPLVPLLIYLVVRVIKHRKRLVRWELPGMLHVPLLRRTVIAANLAHAAGIMAAMLKSGYPLDEVLETLAASCLSGRYQRLFLRARKLVVQGMPLSHALEREGSLIATPFKTAVAQGELSGDMAGNLEYVEAMYTERVVGYGQMLLGIVFPVCIGVIGFFVGFICVSSIAAQSSMADIVLWTR